MNRAQLLAVAVVVSGFAIIAGAYLPWAEVDVFGGTLSVSGVHMGTGTSEGMVAAALGTLIVILGFCLPLFDHVGQALFVALLGLGGVIFAVYELVQVRHGYGAGLFVIAVASAVVLVAGLASPTATRRALERREAQDQRTGKTRWD